MPRFDVDSAFCRCLELEMKSADSERSGENILEVAKVDPPKKFLDSIQILAKSYLLSFRFIFSRKSSKEAVGQILEFNKEGVLFADKHRANLKLPARHPVITLLRSSISKY